MADFRRFLPALALFALIAMVSVPASAQSAFTCVNNAGVPPTVRAEGITELVGDLVLNCSGTAGTVPAGGIIANVQIFLNTNVTSRITSGTTLEALLILNEGVPTSSAPNPYFQGTLAGANSVVWLGVPILAPGSTSTIIRMTNVRANASAVSAINPSLPSSLIPAQIVAFISITGSTSVPVNNPQQIVAFAQQGLVSSITSANYKQCISAVDAETGQPSPLASFSFTEGFASSFKPGYNVLPAAPGLVGRGGAPGAPAQSSPGVAYYDESGFILPSIAGVGSASQGTQLQVVFTNIPSGATVWVPSILGTDATSYAWLLGTSTGAPPFGAATWTALTASGTTATATYEVAASNPFAIDVLTGSLYLTFTSNPASGVPSLTPAMSAALSFAPISTVVVASATDPIPRFVNTGVATSIVTVSACVTNLLYPYVTTVTGFDTGIAIANTDTDVAGLTTTSPGQAGTCTVYLFGTGAPTTAPVTGTIAAGTVYAWSLYNGSTDGAIPSIPNFSGYIIARCAFQYGHGYAFISNLGLGPTGWAQSYLALVIPDRGGTRPPDPFTTAGAGSGEILSQ